MWLLALAGQLTGFGLSESCMCMAGCNLIARCLVPTAGLPHFGPAGILREPTYLIRPPVCLQEEELAKLGLDASKAHRLETAETAEALYKKREKKPAPEGW